MRQSLLEGKISKNLIQIGEKVNGALLRVYKIQMDPIPCKRQRFWIRSRVNAPTKVDRIQMDQIPFGSDPV